MIRISSGKLRIEGLRRQGAGRRTRFGIGTAWWLTVLFCGASCDGSGPTSGTVSRTESPTKDVTLEATSDPEEYALEVLGETEFLRETLIADPSAVDEALEKLEVCRKDLPAYEFPRLERLIENLKQGRASALLARRLESFERGRDELEDDPAGLRACLDALRALKPRRSDSLSERYDEAERWLKQELMLLSVREILATEIDGLPSPREAAETLTVFVRRYGGHPAADSARKRLTALRKTFPEGGDLPDEGWLYEKIGEGSDGRGDGRAGRWGERRFGRAATAQAGIHLP